MKYNTDKEACSCLECGESLYGRKDKQFCSPECKNKFNNRRMSCIRRCKTAILAALTRNYEILDMLIKAKISSIDLEALSEMGFNDKTITGQAAGLHRHQEYSCFDICYYKSETKIFGIRRSGPTLSLSSPSPSPNNRR